MREPHRHHTNQRDNHTNQRELDKLFKALSNQTRRYILTSIAKNDPNSSSALAIDELGVATADQVDSQHTVLHHQHLPQLDEVKLIDWDQETGVVTRGPRFEDIEPFIDLVEAFEGELPRDGP